MISYLRTPLIIVRGNAAADDQRKSLISQVKNLEIGFGLNNSSSTWQALLLPVILDFFF